RQGNQGEAWADAAEPGEHLDHGNSRLEPPLVVGAALSRAQRHQPERLLREAIHGDGRYAALLHPFTDAWPQMNGIGPEFRLAEGAVGPQGLDHGDLAWRWAHPGPFEIVGVHALAGDLAADVENHRLAHHNAVKLNRVDSGAIGIKVPRRIDVGADMRVE